MECPTCHTQMIASKAGWLCGGCGYMQAAVLDLPHNEPVEQPSMMQPLPDLKPRLINVNVEQSVGQYILATPLAQAAIIGLVLILSAGAFFSEIVMNSVLGFGILLFWLGVLLFATWRMLQVELAAKFLQRFARANLFKFASQTAYTGEHGSLFDLPGRRHLFDLVEGDYGGQNLKFYLYERAVGERRQQRTFRYSILELVLPGSVHQLVITAKSRLPMMGYEGPLPQLEPLRVEGDFNRSYNIHITPGQQIQALVLLSPDVLAILADNLRSFDLEVNGDRLFLYYNNYITSQTVLGDMFNVANLVMDKIGPMVERGA